MAERMRNKSRSRSRSTERDVEETTEHGASKLVNSIINSKGTRSGQEYKTSTRTIMSLDGTKRYIDVEGSGEEEDNIQQTPATAWDPR
jgi:hypothetical protein